MEPETKPRPPIPRWATAPGGPWTAVREPVGGPHEYVTPRAVGEARFSEFTGLLRDHGVSKPYEDGRRYRYLHADGWRYWIAPWPCLNRAREDSR